MIHRVSTNNVTEINRILQLIQEQASTPTSGRLASTSTTNNTTNESVVTNNNTVEFAPALTEWTPTVTNTTSPGTGKYFKAGSVVFFSIPCGLVVSGSTPVTATLPSTPSMKMACSANGGNAYVNTDGKAHCDNTGGISDLVITGMYFV
jgi:cytoskeletal protein RodZ